MGALQAGIREFRDQPAAYLPESETPVAITRHGDTVGGFIPRAANAETPNEHRQRKGPHAGKRFVTPKEYKKMRSEKRQNDFFTLWLLDAVIQTGHP
ncbi:MAG TPA: hypothetical protein VFU55_11670 [Terracidiphilus sp.]|nr:hypothetical protein [Terracidiphilus sp.]